MRGVSLLGILLICLLVLPAAEDRCTWDLSPVPGVKTDDTFLGGLIEDLRTAPFDSRKLEDAVRDLTLEENRKHGVPTLCAAMAKPDFTNLFGPCQVAIRLFKDGQKTLALRMLPFLATVSERCTEAEGLSAFAWVTPQFRDLRVVPRLVQLLEHPSEMVRADSGKALSQLTLVPVDKVTLAEMRQWLARNRGKTGERVWHEGLSSKDPRLAMAAATMAFDDRDKDVVNALCTVLRCIDNRLVDQARYLLERIVGNDWGCKSELPPIERVKQVAKLEKWWAAEKQRFQWMADRNDGGAKEEGLATTEVAPVAVAEDPHHALIQQLGSTDGLQSEQAESRLRDMGRDCIRSLIGGLEDPNLVVRRKCDKVLKAITRQDMGYDPRADAAAIAAAIARWKAWAAAEKIPSGNPPPVVAPEKNDVQEVKEPEPAPAPKSSSKSSKQKNLPRGL